MVRFFMKFITRSLSTYSVASRNSTNESISMSKLNPEEANSFSRNSPMIVWEPISDCDHSSIGYRNSSDGIFPFIPCTIQFAQRMKMMRSYKEWDWVPKISGMEIIIEEEAAGLSNTIRGKYTLSIRYSIWLTAAETQMYFVSDSL